MQKKETIIATSAFIACLVMGYGITKLVKPNKPIVENKIAFKTRFETYTDTIIKDMDTIERRATIRYDDQIVNNIDTIYGEGKVIDTKERIVGQVVHVESIPEPNPMPVNPSSSLKPTSTPKPPKHVISSEGDNNIPLGPTPKTVSPLMTKGEFQSLLLNSLDNTLEGGGSKKVSGNVSISVVNMHSDENRPYSPAGVREKIETKTWKSARVVSIVSDPKTGQIVGATVEPIY